MFNLDGAGREGSKDIALMGWSELLPYYRAIAADMLHPMIVDNKISMYSDMFPFFLQGSERLLQRHAGQPLTRGWGHTIADTLDKVSLRGLQGDAFSWLASCCAWPAARAPLLPIRVGRGQGPAREQGLDEVLRLEKRYPF